MRRFQWSTCDVNDKKTVEEVRRMQPAAALALWLSAGLQFTNPHATWLQEVSLHRYLLVRCMQADATLVNSLCDNLPLRLRQIYQLLTFNYVEDDDNMFRCAAAACPTGQPRK